MEFETPDDGFVVVFYRHGTQKITQKEERIKKKYTQEEMSKLLGISLRQYVRIDNEEDLPRRDVLRNLIIELDLTNEEIGAYIRKMTKNIA